MSGLIWLQTVCKVYQQMGLVAKKAKLIMQKKVLVNLFVEVDALHHKQQFFSHVWDFSWVEQVLSGG